jgi:hypothetical protein
MSFKLMHATPQASGAALSLSNTRNSSGSLPFHLNPIKLSFQAGLVAFSIVRVLRVTLPTLATQYASQIAAKARHTTSTLPLSHGSIRADERTRWLSVLEVGSFNDHNVQHADKVCHPTST